MYIGISCSSIPVLRPEASRRTPAAVASVAVWPAIPWMLGTLRGRRGGPCHVDDVYIYIYIFLCIYIFNLYLHTYV